MGFDLKEEILFVVTALETAGIEYALCGGVAVTIHGYPRATRDIDLLIQESDLDRVREALGVGGYTWVAGIIPFDTGKPMERRIYRISKVRGEDLMTLDFLLINPFLEDVWKDRSQYEFWGRQVWVTSKEGLVKMKRAAGRPIDFSDIENLPKGNEQ